MSVPGSGYEVGNPYTERSEGSGSMGTQMLRCTQHDSWGSCQGSEQSAHGVSLISKYLASRLIN